MSAAPEHLMAIDGVTGLCVHRGGTIEFMNLDTLPEENAAALCRAVSKAFSAYAASERQLTEAYFGFADQSILVIARGSASPGNPPDLFLTFLLRDRKAAAALVPAALAWMKDRDP